ncbi:Ribosomal protein Rsm22-like [Trinorchestia longiramus]|nr:Ribosomal protein Rsm22-like [Trinorchestia longiramus]
MKSLSRCWLYSKRPLQCCGRFAALRDASTVPHSFKKANVGENFAIEVEDEGRPVKVDGRPSFAYFLSQAVQESIAKSTVGQHPGKRKLNDVSLPDNLAAAMKSVIQGVNSGPEFLQTALKLKRQIQERFPPLDHRIQEEKRKEFMEQILSQESLNAPDGGIWDEDEEFLSEKNKHMLSKRIRETIFNYQPFDFSTPERACLYMMARLVPDYAALIKTFHQLRCALPDFEPTSLLDFGSGVGSVTWAVDATWPKACKEVVNVDCSSAMHELHELLLKGGIADRPLPRRENSTHFRSFMPLTGTIKHSLVVSSRSFLELDSRDMRLRTLDILWKTVMPGGCLVLVENGRAGAGCTVMLEAREFLLSEMDEDRQSGRTRGIIVAPCPHQNKCPLLLKKPKHRICSDSQTYMEVKYPNRLLEVFSYLIVQKPENPGQTAEHLKSWPRVVQPVIKKSPILVRVCNKFGNLQELAAAKEKHGTMCKQVARKCNLGDLYPVEVVHPDLHINPGYNQLDLMRAKLHSTNIAEDC